MGTARHGDRRRRVQPRNARAAPCMCLVAAMDVALAASGALVASGRPAWQHDIGSALKRASRDPTAKYLQLGTVSRELRPRVRLHMYSSRPPCGC